MRELAGMVVPVYFEPSVEEEQVRHILTTTLQDHGRFLDAARVVFVVDRNTTAEGVLAEVKAELAPASETVFLDRNQGKMGAVRDGLQKLLEAPVDFLVTRDCDGEHRLEDLSGMVAIAQEMRLTEPGRALSVFGARPSLARPMEWIRKEWEILTNSVFESFTEYLLAQRGCVLDRRYWNGYPLDLQSGYRLYDRAGAELAVRSMRRLPDERAVYLMACEMVPFLEISLAGGLVGQVQRTTSVEQPVSSFKDLDFATAYGELLSFLGSFYECRPATLVQMFDNHMLDSEIFFSAARSQVLACRNLIGGREIPVRHASIM